VRVISLGAGVQSTTMALLAKHGEITPMPDCAIFADTGWEPRKVYDHLNWLIAQLPFPVHTVSKEPITNHLHKPGYSAIPWYTAKGPGRRQCTKEFKLYPIADKQKELMGIVGRSVKPGEIQVEVWVGISTDEAVRMKPASRQWQTNRWPLIELGMSRWDCLQWLERQGYPKPPKSACIGCPYHSDAEWREMRDTDPESWANALDFDYAIRNQRDEPQFIHRSCKPLAEVDLSTAEDHGQLNLFNNECEGMCGV
jgi:hypothetical protein